MKHYLFLVFIFLFFCATLPGYAQQYDYVDLSIRANKGQSLRYFYKDVMVLDNRVDSIIFREQEDLKKMRLVTFKGPASIAVTSYIRSRTDHLEKNNETLLIDLTELRVPNKPLQRVADPENENSKWSYTRGYIYFSADVYEGSGSGTYRKLFSIHRKRYVYVLVKDKVRDIMDDLVELTEQVAMNRAGKKGSYTAAYKSYKKNSCFFEHTDETVYSMAEINKTKLQQWSHHAAFVKKPDMSACVYPLFENFKKGNCVESKVTLKPVGIDSLFQIEFALTDSAKAIYTPFVVCDTSGYYIALVRDYYVKLTFESGLFRFTVPSNLPDMYQLLSNESVKNKDRFRLLPLSDIYSPVSVFDMGTARIPILDIIHLVDKEGKLRRIKNAAYSPSHRHCFVDLDSGDFIYD